MDLFDLYARIGLDDSEYNRKIDSASEKGSSFATSLGNGLKTAGKVAGVALAAAATGIAALTKQALDGYADQEQLVGGVETLFGAAGQSLEEYASSVGKTTTEAEESYNDLMRAQRTVLNNADEAYKTAGLSANEYMETVTSFSAAMIQSVGGDTKKAADYADQAIIDMSDNANKMGSSMESIQTAYQGFAKQNYTMLDNLKLGYGGTKEEMQRLLDDAAKLSGQKFDLSSYADVTQAIHVVQTEMGITGTTAKEASETIQGSVGMMKSAWANFINSMGNEEENYAVLGFDDALIESVDAVIKNVVPRVQTIIPSLVEGLGQIFNTLVEYIPPLVGTLLPSLIDGASSLINSFIQALPAIISVLSETIPMVVNALLTMLPLLVQAGLEIIISLATGIADSIPELVPTIVDVVLQIVDMLTDPDTLSALIDAAIAITIALASGLIESLPKLIEKAPEIIENLVKAIIENVPKLLKAAVEVIVTLVNGISQNLYKLGAAAGTMITTLVNGVKELWEKIKGIGSDIVDKIKEGISAAWDGIKSWFNGLWDGLFGGRTVDVKANTSSSGMSKYASGTNYASGGLSLVGEMGPELVSMPRGSRVYTNSETKQMLGSGSDNRDINVQIDGDTLFKIMRKKNGEYAVRTGKGAFA